MRDVLKFNPREYPGVTIDRDTVIVTTNHLGADMNGDAGLDVQYLADVSGHTVIGMNRLGSGDGVNYSRALAKELTKRPEDVTARWVATIGPEVVKQSPSRVELVGRSAGANLMLHVAALELIPLTEAVLAIEGLRFDPINTRLGYLMYIHYKLRKEGKYKDRQNDIVDPDLLLSRDVRPAKAVDPRSMLRRQLIDIRHSQHLWASDLPFKNALHIAKNVDIRATILLAEESMAAESPKKELALEELYTARATSSILRLIVAETVKFTTHGSFDDPRLYATHYRSFAAGNKY